MIRFKRTADLYYDEHGNLVACISRRFSQVDTENDVRSEQDIGIEFIPNGTGLQELLDELVPKPHQQH